jgi:hypothetical protein
MTTNLLDLVSKFRDVNNRESEGAFFRTHAPWVGPEAYLNIIFKPAPKDVLADAGSRLNIPFAFTKFLAKQNGAILFSGVLSIYGTHWPGQLLNVLTRSRGFLSTSNLRTLIAHQMIRPACSPLEDTAQMDRAFA